MDVQTVISIGYVSSFSDDRDVLVRKSLSVEDGIILVRTFIERMECLQQKYFETLPHSIRDHLLVLKLRMTDKSLSVEAKSLLVQKFRYLENLTKLKIIGYNSNRYDLPCLMSYFLEVMGPENINVIKKGSSVFSLNYKYLTFRDALNYSEWVFDSFQVHYIRNEFDIF